MPDQKYVAWELQALVEAPRVRMLGTTSVDVGGAAPEASELGGRTGTRRFWVVAAEVLERYAAKFGRRRKSRRSITQQHSPFLGWRSFK